MKNYSTAAEMFAGNIFSHRESPELAAQGLSRLAD
jgi:hypothetical protein